jgi:uncharacterized OB-fold protein
MWSRTEQRRNRIAPPPGSRTDRPYTYGANGISRAGRCCCGHTLYTARRYCPSCGRPTRIYVWPLTTPQEE